VEETRVRLNVLGITFSQVQAGAYALVLAEEGGARRVPIIIGTPEAQSIAIFFEGLHPPRPLTHDLFISLVQALGVALKEINIYRFEEGIFYSKLIFIQGDKEIVIDSRTSDAIALAIRTDSPIYTTEPIMQEAGIIMEDELQETLGETFPEKRDTELDYETMTMDELQQALNEAVAREDYEKASHIRDLMNKNT
jgi:bifunctional DNase/RNase